MLGFGFPKAVECPSSKNYITLKLDFPISIFNYKNFSKVGAGSVRPAVTSNNPLKTSFLYSSLYTCS